MTRPQGEPVRSDIPDTRATWEPPTVTPVGTVRDLVHGVGKLSGDTDGDAGSIRKAPGLG
jgi:hypothetical protein